MRAPADGGCTKEHLPRTGPSRRGGRVRLSFLPGPVFLLLFPLVAPALSIHMESVESHSEFSCEPIRLRMCQDLPYNTTFMPNLLNHYDQQTAALAMEVGGCCVAQPWVIGSLVPGRREVILRVEEVNMKLLFTPNVQVFVWVMWCVLRTKTLHVPCEKSVIAQVVWRYTLE